MLTTHAHFFARNRQLGSVGQLGPRSHLGIAHRSGGARNPAVMAQVTVVWHGLSKRAELCVLRDPLAGVTSPYSEAGVVSSSIEEELICLP